uniref:Uncharacterized protein n=1 Tax=Chelonoidis abingdonii TaxID=106734 RepID=A0A8C0HBM8_CHEAB
MALISAWPLLFPILFFLGCFFSSAASSEGSVFHFDIEGSAAVSNQESAVIRGQQQSVATGTFFFHMLKCQEGFYQTASGDCSRCNCNGNANKCLDGSGICVVSHVCHPHSLSSFLLQRSDSRRVVLGFINDGF